MPIDEWLVGYPVLNMRTWGARARPHFNKCLTALTGLGAAYSNFPDYSWDQK